MRKVGGNQRGDGRRAHHRRHQPEPARDDRGGQLPRGPLLPHQRHPDRTCRRCASAARTSRSWSTTSSRSTPRELGTAPKRISAEAMRLLESYDWPGNVRELENMIERALALSTGAVINAADLPQQVRTGSERASQSIMLPKDGVDLEGLLDEIRSRPHAAGARAHRRRADPGGRAAAHELPLVPLLREEGGDHGVGATAPTTTSTTRWTSSRRRDRPAWWAELRTSGDADAADRSAPWRLRHGAAG